MDLPNKTRLNDSNNSDSLLDDTLFQTSDGKKLLNFLKNKRVETKPLFLRTIQKNKPESFVLNDSAFININNEKNVNPIQSSNECDITPPFKVPVMPKTNSLRRRLLEREFDIYQQSSVANYSRFDSENIVASTPTIPPNKKSKIVEKIPVEKSENHLPENDIILPTTTNNHLPENDIILPTTTNNHLSENDIILPTTTNNNLSENDIILPTTTNNIVEDILSNTSSSINTNIITPPSMYRKASLRNTNINNKSMVLTMVRSPQKLTTDIVQHDITIKKIQNDLKWCPVVKTKRLQVSETKNSFNNNKTNWNQSQRKIDQNEYNADHVNEEPVLNVNEDINSSNINKNNTDEHHSNTELSIEKLETSIKENINNVNPNQTETVISNDENMSRSQSSITDKLQINDKEIVIIPLKILENIKQLNNTIKSTADKSVKDDNSVKPINEKKKKAKARKKVNQPEKTLLSILSQTNPPSEISKRKLYSSNSFNDKNNEEIMNIDNYPKEEVSRNNKIKSISNIITQNTVVGNNLEVANKKKKQSSTKDTKQKQRKDKTTQKNPSPLKTNLRDEEESTGTRKSSRTKKAPIAYWSSTNENFLSTYVDTFKMPKPREKKDNRKPTEKKKSIKKNQEAKKNLQIVSDIIEDFRELEDNNNKTKHKDKISKKPIKIIQSAPELNSYTVNTIENLDNMLSSDKSVNNENRKTAKRSKIKRSVSFANRNNDQYQLNNKQIAHKDSGNGSFSLRNNNHNSNLHVSPIICNNKSNDKIPLVNNKKRNNTFPNKNTKPRNSLLPLTDTMSPNEITLASNNNNNILWLNNMMDLNKHVSLDITTKNDNCENILSKIDNLLFYDFNGIGYTGYSVDKNCMDGYLRFAPAIKKARASSKKFTLRFIVMGGQFTFIIDKKHFLLNGGDYIVIPKGISYEMFNSSSEKVGLLLYTKML